MNGFARGARACLFRRRSWRVASVLCCASGCLPSFELPEESPIPAPGCGTSGQPCCEAPASPCGAELRCDAGTSTCQPAINRHCVTDDNCSAGQTCCLSGLLGTCVQLAAGAECPRADLQIVATRESLTPWREERFFDPEATASDACALEKLCIGGPGLRRLFHFSLAVLNSGDADLLLGAPSVAPFTRAACDGRWYLANFLSYTLVKLDGTSIAKGFMQAQCGALPAPFTSGFDCEFHGLARGFADAYPDFRQLDSFPTAESDPTDCQWLDITGVPAGNYVLRLRVNAGGVLLEKNGANNQVDLPIEIPKFDEPTQSCPSSDPYSLLGVGVERECGWVGSAVPAACVPGQGVTLACPDCRGDPMLRVCEGAAACLGPSALAAGDSTQAECDGGPEVLSDQDCTAVCCQVVSECPSVHFECPESGRYTAYTAAYDTQPASCEAAVQPVAAPGGDASL